MKPTVRKHPSGLRSQEVTGPGDRMLEAHVVALPAFCPISGNPRPGSTLALLYRPRGWCIEVYSLEQLLGRFVGGFPGAGPYPAERNMEGAIRLLAQMTADAVGVPVRAVAKLKLDAGGMELRVRAKPVLR